MPDCTAAENDASLIAGEVLWLTGLSSAGKSTLARLVVQGLRGRGRSCVWLDGDVVRRGLCSDLGFGQADRVENVRRLACVAKLLSDQGVIVVVSAISPYRSSRDQARKMMGHAFIEVFVDAPIEVCIERDQNGVYHRGHSGLTSGISGIDAPYEAPQRPEVHCRTHVDPIELCRDQILSAVTSEVATGRGECLQPKP